MLEQMETLSNLKIMKLYIQAHMYTCTPPINIWDKVFISAVAVLRPLIE